MIHFNKIVIVLFLSSNLFGFGFSSITSMMSEKEKEKIVPFGIISINNPGLDDDDYSEETQEFFNELASDIFATYNDGIIMISNKKRVPIKIKDMLYDYEGKKLLLYPNQYNEDQILAVGDFYQRKKLKGIRHITSVANENRVKVVAYGVIPKLQLKKVVQNNNDSFMFSINIFLVDSGANKQEFVKVYVKNINTSPEYEPDILLASIEKKVLKAYDAVLATITAAGVPEDDSSDDVEENNEKDNDNEENGDNDSDDDKKDLDSSEENEEEGGDDDW
ncbi:MAG: hypothetical protein U9R37_04465 [Campylobacterota bacterium]|nr:hypothetical protein [Campylobacterota bacterium]